MAGTGGGDVRCDARAPSALQQLVDALDDAPVHIHIAEQTGKVDDCVAATGQWPIARLADQAPLDARWQLVHATHATPAEFDAVAATGAGVVPCPTTEADLGDGSSLDALVFPGPGRPFSDLLVAGRWAVRAQAHARGAAIAARFVEHLGALQPG